MELIWSHRTGALKRQVLTFQPKGGGLQTEMIEHESKRREGIQDILSARLVFLLIPTDIEVKPRGLHQASNTERTQQLLVIR